MIHLICTLFILYIHTCTFGLINGVVHAASIVFVNAFHGVPKKISFNWSCWTLILIMPICAVYHTYNCYCLFDGVLIFYYSTRIAGRNIITRLKIKSIINVNIVGIFVAYKSFERGKYMITVCRIYFFDCGIFIF